MTAADMFFVYSIPAVAFAGVAVMTWAYFSMHTPPFNEEDRRTAGLAFLGSFIWPLVLVAGVAVVLFLIIRDGIRGLR